MTTENGLTSSEVNGYLARLHTVISPYVAGVLNNQKPRDIFQWRGHTPFAYAINPFTEDREAAGKLIENLHASNNPNHLGMNLEEIARLSNRVQGRLRDLAILEPRTNGYLLMMKDLTDFVRDYNRSPPRLQKESDLRYILGGHGQCLLVEPEDEYVPTEEEWRTLSPQFFLPIAEQMANYEKLRNLLTDLNPAELDRGAFNQNVSRLFEESAHGALYFINCPDTLTGSRQAIDRFLNDKLCFRSDILRRRFGRHINQYSLSAHQREGCFVERRARWFELPLGEMKNER